MHRASLLARERRAEKQNVKRWIRKSDYSEASFFTACSDKWCEGVKRITQGLDDLVPFFPEDSCVQGYKGLRGNALNVGSDSSICSEISTTSACSGRRYWRIRRFMPGLEGSSVQSIELSCLQGNTVQTDSSYDAWIWWFFLHWSINCSCLQGWAMPMSKAFCARTWGALSLNPDFCCLQWNDGGRGKTWNVWFR